MVRLLVRLNFGQMYCPGEALGEVDLWSDVLPSRHLVAKCDATWIRLTFSQTLGQVDLQSDLPPGRDILWPIVILLWGEFDIWSDFQVRMTFGQAYPQADILWPSMIQLQVSLVPAAAVIPAPLAYIEVVAVKTVHRTAIQKTYYLWG